MDTNVISELRKPQCRRQVREWAEARSRHDLYLSTVTLAEIRFGIERLRDHERQAQLQAWIDASLRPWFAGRILEVDENVIVEWRRMVAIGREHGHTYSQPDLFLAAIASHHNLVLVTRNTRDFPYLDLALLNPWQPL